ncbi:MAG TPA: NADH:ubiquinone reductase (Na(+)-transporting) subunit B, partial [Flavobacteriaceae bacterium]|nr:NADH:ubiquinone reductase (Na(+)-transporting) subunit B [Flavobacteriaceae bacterium]
MGLKQKLHTLKEKYKGKKMAPAFNALHTFLYLPNETTRSGSHVRAADDLKRTMNTVILALVPCLIFGIFNAGYQHYAALDETLRAAPVANFFTWDNFIMGCWTVLPLVIVSYGVGLAVEFLFAVIKGHEVEEG